MARAARSNAGSKHQWILLALAVPLQMLTLYAVPLVFECDAAAYYNFSVSGTYRPPLFPAFLWLTGQYHLQSFVGTVVAHAALGVVAPLLLYRIVAVWARGPAFLAALLYTLSLVPFTAAKLMLSEQLFTTFVLGSLVLLSSYVAGAPRHWFVWSVVCALGAMFTRWEGQALLGAVLLCGAVLAWRRRDVKGLALGLVLVLLTCGGWSMYRAIALKDARVFGTLNNGSGDQLYWQMYGYMSPEVYGWERYLASDPAPAPVLAERAAAYRVLRPDAGPAASELADRIRQIAKARPDEDVLGARTVGGEKGGYFTRLGGDPDRLVQDIFSAPSSTYVFSVPAELRRELGPRDSERLLNRVNFEAIRAHPTFWLSKTVVALNYLGVFVPSPLALLAGAPLTPKAMLMVQWDEIHYANVPFDLGQCASGSLPARMLGEYRWDSRLPRSSARFVALMSFARNVVRNVVGPIVLVLGLLALFTPAALLYVTVAASAVVLIGVVAVLGGGVYTRYEYAVIPLLLVLFAGILQALGNGVHRLMPAGRRSLSQVDIQP